MPDPVRKHIGYARVSTDEQADRGHSLPAQTASIRAQARARNHRLAEVISDRVSGTSLKRSGVQRLRQMIAAGEVASVYVWRMDRLTRSVRDLLDLHALLIQHKSQLVSVTESLDTSTPTGECVMTIIASIAQLESRQIGLRIRAVKDHQIATGRQYTATPPYGYRFVRGRIAPDLYERKVIRLVKRQRARGMPRRSIAEWLATHRYHTRTRRPWRPQNIARILSPRHRLRSK